MTPYLFQFGYESPQQRLANESNGWDDEASQSILVLAESEDAAIGWGREVAESFVAHLYRSAGWQGEVPSWKASEFSHWVEPSPAKVFSVEELVKLPRVREGELPDFSAWLAT